jgi:crossover junction endodeoxyribonuclease RusA
MKLVLPFPDSRLLPNVKLHWAVKARAARDAKMLAWVEAIKFRQSKPLQNVTVRVVWFPPDKRRRDEDNYTRATKHYMDGIVGARLIEDDNAKVIKHVERHFGPPDKSNPRTEIEIEVI